MVVDDVMEFVDEYFAKHFPKGGHQETVQEMDQQQLWKFRQETGVHTWQISQMNNA
jgi:hypothetical protein